MNITGIIAEYNPFHNGHAYQLACARRETQADYIIVIMSGNFVQRGAPALLDKYTRAEMALRNGADLVLELPVLWATASAEYFASAGVSLLGQLGCADTLCYGCETPDTRLFSIACRLLNEEPPEYKKLLANFLKNGSSYALARERSVRTLLAGSDIQNGDLDMIFQSPNNILALEYQRAIARMRPSFRIPMRVHPILRKGQGYHSTDLTGRLDSASAIRRHLLDKPPDCHSSISLKDSMPDTAYRLLMEYRDLYPLLSENDCSQILRYCLLEHAPEGFQGYADCPADLSDKICRMLDSFHDFTDLCTRLKSKNIAYTRISRILLHILLGIRQQDYGTWRQNSYVPYARVLGFRKGSQTLLALLKKTSSVPLLVRTTDAEKLLSSQSGYPLFEQNLFADRIYRSLIMEKSTCPFPGEYQRKPLIL